jgi:hypothetical protein
MMGVEKQRVVRGEKYHFQKRGGINIIFEPKYRLLYESVSGFYSQ